MKTYLFSYLNKIKIPLNGILIVLLFVMVSFTLMRCKDESISLQNKGETAIRQRGGEDDPSTVDILELIGTACVPGSINIGTGCNDVEYTDTAIVYLTAYTGCSFSIVYHYYLCTAGSLIDYTMGDFQILSHNCSGFTSALGSALTAGGSTLTNFV